MNLKKFGAIFSVCIVIGLFVAPLISFAQTRQNQNSLNCPDGTPKVFNELGGEICDTGNGKTTTSEGRAVTPTDVASSIGLATINNPIAQALFKALAWALMTLSALVLIFAGTIFDWIIQFSILDLATHLNSPTGVGSAISAAWGTLRDISNILFIFVLLYTAFRAMFSLSFGNVGKTIINIILVALLINFSLFFTKVVIDASNVVAIGFYRSIENAGGPTPQTVSATATGNKFGFSGISGGYMRLLGLQSFHSPQTLDNFSGDSIKIFVVGFMSSLFMLITAVIFGIAGLMFVARFIILMFLMVLSPVALIAIVVPGMRGRFDQWLSSLTSQAFFAPVFFALTWVSLRIGSSIKTSIVETTKIPIDGQTLTTIVTDTPNAAGLLLNFILIIGFAVAALVISKGMASKGLGFNTVSGAVGAGVLGGAAALGRNTLGRGSRWIVENKKDSLSKTRFGRSVLWTADKGASSSFDGRAIADTRLAKATGLGKEMGILGKAGGKGGFSKIIADKAKAKADHAKQMYGQTDEEKERAAKQKDLYEGYTNENGVWVKGAKDNYDEARKEEEKNIREDRKSAEEKARKEKEEAVKDVETREKAALQARDNRIAGTGTTAEEEEAQKELTESRTRLANVAESHRKAIEKLKAQIEDDEYTEETRALKQEAARIKGAWEEAKNAGGQRQREYAERVRSGSPISTGGGALGGMATGAAAGSLLGPVGTLVGGVIGAGVGGGLGKWVGGKIPMTWAANKAAAREIITQSKGKSKEARAAELLEEFNKDSGGGKKKEENQEQENTAEEDKTAKK